MNHTRRILVWSERLFALIVSLFIIAAIYPSIEPGSQKTNWAIIFDVSILLISFGCIVVGRLRWRILNFVGWFILISLFLLALRM